MTIDYEWSPATHTWDARSPLQARSRLVSYSLPAPGLGAAAFLHRALGRPRFFWQKGDNDTIYAGFGIAVQLMAWGTERFRQIEQQARELFAEAQVLGPHAAPLLPRLFGGFSFSDDFTPDNTWAVFHPAHFVLPHYQFVSGADGPWLTINALTAEGENLDALRDQLHFALSARYRQLIDAQNPRTALRHNIATDVNYPMTRERWSQLVEHAITAMDADHLNKVVLARICELTSPTPVDVGMALDYLGTSFPDCTRFLFEPRPFHAFYGATPETLVSVNGDRMTTMALAGSRPRGASPKEDASLANELLTSSKERFEHQLVVDSLRCRLAPITADLRIASEPTIYTLSYIQHLLTRVSGRLFQKQGVLSLVELLHPTPALGGSPRELALAFISKYEPVPRGWYAAPVGWFDPNMDGEFAVAIRSAVAQERRVWCYAGAGIVPDSDPNVEWDETGLKFEPMLSALGVPNVQVYLR